MLETDNINIMNISENESTYSDETIYFDCIEQYEPLITLKQFQQDALQVISTKDSGVI